ncbi:trypsin-like serine protease [Streptomyces sp. NPDC047928]|uniref:trypsin-like serine protease n=1 Tax=unclassified Streptomyces TaxID=2593676 RepID=UPI00371E36EB
MASHRRARIALPAAFAAIALGAGILTVMPSAEATDPQTPKPEIPTVVSTAEVKQRAAEYLKGEDKPADERPEGVEERQPSKSSSPADPKVIGGVDASTGTAPWMVQLYGVDKATGEDFFCGGSLIAPAKVLTAAHCVYGADWTNQGFVVGGATRRVSEDAAGNPVFHGGKPAVVKRAWVNPGYSDATLKGDIAVLTLDRPLPLPTLRFASPTETAAYRAGTQATVYGWGRTSSEPDSPISETLKVATLPIQADSVCPGWDEAKPYFIAGQMFCGGEPASGSDSGTVSPCNGDSGGPLLVNGRIVGVVSWGIEDCVGAGARSVYAKVSTFSAHIARNVDDANTTDDDKADLIARKKTNYNAYLFASQGARSLAAGEWLGVWDNISLIRQADLNRDSNQDLIYRTLNGDLWWSRVEYRESTNAYDHVETKIGAGWGKFKNIYIPGDLTGDTYPDVIGMDPSGVLWMWKGRSTGTLQAPVKISSGWLGTGLFAKGDFSADGKPDMLARDPSGNLWMYTGTGSATTPFATTRLLVGKGWNFNGYAAVGDLTGDNLPDFVARDSSGYLWAYTGTGKPTAPFATAAKVRIGAGWNGFDQIG